MEVGRSHGPVLPAIGREGEAPAEPRATRDARTRSGSARASPQCCEHDGRSGLFWARLPRRAFHGGSPDFVPVGTPDNSPPFQQWESDTDQRTSPVRDGRRWQSSVPPSSPWISSGLVRRARPHTGTEPGPSRRPAIPETTITSSVNRPRGRCVRGHASNPDQSLRSLSMAIKRRRQNCR